MNWHKVEIKSITRPSMKMIRKKDGNVRGEATHRQNKVGKEETTPAGATRTVGNKEISDKVVSMQPLPPLGLNEMSKRDTSKANRLAGVAITVGFGVACEKGGSVEMMLSEPSIGRLFDLPKIVECPWKNGKKMETWKPQSLENRQKKLRHSFFFFFDKEIFYFQSCLMGTLKRQIMFIENYFFEDFPYGS